jgi:hypothetical protein
VTPRCRYVSDLFPRGILSPFPPRSVPPQFPQETHCSVPILSRQDLARRHPFSFPAHTSKHDGMAEWDSGSYSFSVNGLADGHSNTHAAADFHCSLDSSIICVPFQPPSRYRKNCVRCVFDSSCQYTPILCHTRPLLGRPFPSTLSS